MSSSDLQGLRAAGQQLASFGKEHVDIAASGGFRATTSGVIQRFFGRLVSHFSSNARATNEACVNALAEQIEKTPSLGREYADRFRGRAMTLANGKPLSGRAVSAMLDQTITEYVQRNSLNLHSLYRVRFEENFHHRDGFDYLCYEAEGIFHIKHADSDLEGRKTELCDKVANAVKEKTRGHSPTWEEYVVVGRQVVREAAIGNYLLSRRDELLARVQERFGLESGQSETEEFTRLLMDEAYSLSQMEDLTMERLNGKLDVDLTAIGNLLRNRCARGRVTPLVALDSSPDGLHAAYQSRARTLVPGIEIQPQVLEKLQDTIEKLLVAKGKGGTAPFQPVLDVDTLRAHRDTLLDEYFARVQTAINDFSGTAEEREIFAKALLSESPVLNPACMKLAIAMSESVGTLVEVALPIMSPEEMLDVMNTLVATVEKHVQTMIERNPGEEIGPYDRQPAIEAGYGMAIARAAGRLGSEKLIETLTDPTSPFMVLLGTLIKEIAAHDTDISPASAPANAMQSLLFAFKPFMTSEQFEQLLSTIGS